MPFKVLQKYRSAHCSPVTVVTQVTLESGEVIQKTKDISEEKLPDPELFQLDKMIKAGVDLEEVNSKVLSSRSVDAEKVVKKFKKPVNTEVTDEK